MDHSPPVVGGARPGRGGLTAARSIAIPSRGPAELFVHALAQLPDEVELAVPDERTRSRIELLATAYGVFDRVIIGDGEAIPRFTTMAEFVEALGGGADVASVRGDDSVFRGQRVAIVTNFPIHYRMPLLAGIAERLEAAGASAKAFFLSGLQTTRDWIVPGSLEFEHEFLWSVDLGHDRSGPLIPLDLELRLRRFSPTIVLVGGFSPFVAGRLAVFCRANGSALGVWSGEIPGTSESRSRIRSLQRRRLLRHVTFGIAYGLRSAAHLRELSPALPVVIGRNTTSLPLALEPAGGSDRLELLSVGRLERGKRIDVLIDALRLLPDLGCRLTIVGDGAERDALKKRATGDARIRFVGAVRSDRVAEAYRAADAFLFPSCYDIFGLSLVEAMGAALPTVSSVFPGAVTDLCIDGVNALLVSEREPPAWAAAINRLCDTELRAMLGDAAARTVSRRWTIEHAVDAMIAGLRLGVLVGPRKRK